MRPITKILLRLAADLTGNALTSAVAAAHNALEAYLFTPEQRSAASEARERAAVGAMCTRYVARVAARRVAS
jgi:hypothetical protein